MADTEEPQFNTLAERIAALNKQKNFNGSDAPRKKPPPPAPPIRSTNGSTPSHHQVNPTVPPRPNRNNPPPLPRRDTQSSTASGGDGAHQPNGSRQAPPPLPSRISSSASPSPAQVPRRASTQSGLLTARRNSASSEISQHSTLSSVSIGHASSASSYGSNGGAGRKMAPAFDPSSLPPLPPTRRELEAKAKEAAAAEAVEKDARAKEYAAKQAAKPKTPQPSATLAIPSRPTLPPRLPSRPAKSPNPPVPATTRTESEEDTKPAPRKLPPIRGFSSGQSTTDRPPIPTRPSASANDDAPPPIPVASRPSAAQIDAASSRTAEPPKPLNDCWVCRDWSAADGVAAQFPRQSLPRNDPVGHLARGLCDPFPSYTDKARAIFTWFHHNIFYDTVAFFGNNVRHMSVEETIFSGKAVCQGYAETYKAIANRAGLECVVVGGHGKGFGHTPLKKGERPPPPKPDGHAWNAVRIDGGVWKLLDACWGAGHICGANNLYKQEFSPKEFTSSNESFGLRHFPSNPSYQYRSDGRVVSWEEYYRGRVDGEPPVFYTNGHQEGIAEESVEPKEADIAIYSSQVVRFQFSKICEHWTSEKDGLGKPPLLLLSIHGVDGRKDEMVPIETNGYWHWIDVNARDLGAPGQSVQVAMLTSIDGQDGRGVTAKEFLAKKGRVGMAWAYILKWNLV
ncbi:hypothetical protein JDV02_007850 [Purpureocillium takamizusanense]|uniref:Transglutaminase-like domain-containing protein n=1 Tax=Purpureocillium takamizusanense TaxID=2060973 RepID=A0A9Q8VEH6_9HYPO|nr:uncharacterized protein JDV02_007850 [Purpureocillium takamizusanense]UNI21904.1 hypothetical protein JDV02_007850 [Purpureocillium takamizusanense]